MKNLKNFFIALGILAILYVVVALFSPGNYKVERSRIIHTPANFVWNHISTFEMWNAWSPWQEMDRNAKYQFDGTSGTVGAKVSWDGNRENVGVGSMVINELETNKKIGYDLNFTEPWVSSSKGTVTLMDYKDSTQITWVDQGDFSFLQRPMMLFFDFDEMLGKDFNRGLFKIDSLSQISFAEMSSVESVTEGVFEGGTFIGQRHLIKISEMDSAIYAQTYGKLGAFCGKNKINIVGPPASLTYDWSPEKDSCNFVIAFQIDPNSIVPQVPMFEVVKIDTTKVAHYNYYGPYDQSGAAHELLYTYLTANDYELNLVLEQYMNDPTTVSSPSEILTKISYLIKH